MNNQYNSKLYLSTNDLNDIEDLVYDVTYDIRTNLYNGNTSTLKNIESADNLNGKTLYLFIPTNILLTINEGEYVDIIKTTNNNSIGCYRYGNYDYVYISYKGNIEYLYIKKHVTGKSLDRNVRRFVLPFDFGIVNYIDSNNYIFPNIKIYANEGRIPNYVKHTWNDDEFLSMQKIDNIELGIRNIGYYYHKPNGWVNSEEWLKTSDIKNINDNINMRNISYLDLNRWINNLSLINFEDLNNMTIWNTDYTQITWNEDSEIEWEDF